MNENLENKVYKYKSSKERAIGDFLTYKNILFEYEKPTLVIDDNKPKIYYPDFTLNDFAIILEYFGINGDVGYNKRSKHKEEVYKQNKLDFISVYPEHFNNNWQGYIKESIKNILDSRYNKYNKTFH